MYPDLYLALVNVSPQHPFRNRAPIDITRAPVHQLAVRGTKLAQRSARLKVSTSKVARTYEHSACAHLTPRPA